MLGKPNQLQPKLFYNSFSLEQHVHEDHPLRKVKNLIDFSFIRSEVKDLYGYNGNQSIDPTVILKLMFLLFYENIKSERALANQLPVSFFVSSYGMDELPIWGIKVTDFSELHPEGYNRALLIVCLISAGIPALQLLILKHYERQAANQG